MRPRRERAARAIPEAVQLCGIMSREGGPTPHLGDATTVEYRDLVALVRVRRFGPIEPEASEIIAYRGVVEGAFASRAIIPAPFGTVFRSRESLLRWLELHYFTLADALRYLQDRQAARVRITTGLASKGWDTREYKLREHDLEVTAFDSFRVLRKESVAFVSIPVAGRRTEAEAAFLIEREQWGAFTALVKEEQRRLPDLRFEQTGPWPPYDFVHLELSG